MSRRITTRTLFLLLLLPALLRGEIVDRLVAVVGNRIITWSDVAREARYQAFLIGGEPPNVKPLQGKESLQPILERLIDQLLLEQARAAFPFSPPENGQTERRLAEIHNRYSSAEVFQKTLAKFGLTEADLVARLAEEEEAMAFIEYRLHPQIQISPAEIAAYYKGTLQPKLRQEGQSEVPPLAEVQEAIEQILVQQEMDRHLVQWLQELRGRAAIRTLW